MLHTILSRICWFISLFLLQVLVFNHIHILGYATPMPYVFFLAILPSNTPRWAYVLLGFALGLSIDVFANTPGMAAGSLTLTGLLAPLLLHVFGSGDIGDDETFEPTAASMEWGGFLRYLASLTLLHTGAFFVLESFSFFDVQYLLINIAGSAFLSLLFMVAMELIRGKGEKRSRQ